MEAILLNDGRVRRPFNWTLSLPILAHGSGDDPLLRVVEWPDEASYESDVDAGTMSSGRFVPVAVPGFAGGDCQNVPAILSALQGLGGDFAGSTLI